MFLFLLRDLTLLTPCMFCLSSFSFLSRKKSFPLYHVWMSKGGLNSHNDQIWWHLKWSCYALLDFEYNVLISKYLFCVRKYGSKRTLGTKTSHLKSSLSPISNHYGKEDIETYKSLWWHFRFMVVTQKCSLRVVNFKKILIKIYKTVQLRP